MKVLITGGAGYIGSHAAVELLEQGYEIIVADNLSNSKIESIYRIKELTGKDFPFHEVDLLDAKELDSIFTNHKIDAVMHFAGLKVVGESIQQPLAYYHNNITGTLTLCETMDKHRVRNIVFSSTANVYGDPDQVPIDEAFPVSATNPYGRSKQMIEEILHDLFISNPSWRIAILRYFNPVGAHISGRIGENPKGIPTNLMPYITQVAVGKQQQLQVFGDDYDTHDGTGVRDYIHVIDLVKGHLKALEYMEQHEGIEIFNLGTGRGYSVLDLVKSFGEATSQEIPYKIVERRPGDSASSYANPEKAKTLLGWQAEKGLKEMCEDSWNWQSKNPNGF